MTITEDEGLPMANIPILGWYNQQNVGDEAFKDVFRAVVREADPCLTVSFQTPYSPLQSSPDKVILGGGDVIRPFYLQNIPSGVKVFPLGVGLGYESEIELLENIQVPFALFRNSDDAKLAQSRGINAQYCPDLTYFLNDPASFPISLSEGKTLGILLSDEISPTFERKESKEYSYYEYFKWELASILDYLAEFYNLCFVAFSNLKSINDHKVSLDIYRRISARDRVSFITEPLSMAQALWVIKQFDLVISMKFHGIMFAVNQGVPFINIAETRKTQRFCLENDLAQLSIPRYSLERERFLEVVKIAEADETRQAIQSTSARLRELTRKRLPEAIARFMAA
jgi:polysaccharide pyruvyl transferase WcaK-like protein